MRRSPSIGLRVPVAWRVVFLVDGARHPWPYLFATKADAERWNMREAAAIGGLAKAARTFERAIGFPDVDVNAQGEARELGTADTTHQETTHQEADAGRWDGDDGVPWPLLVWRAVTRLAWYAFLVWLAWRALVAGLLLLVLLPMLLVSWWTGRARTRHGERGGYTHD